jgi:hypothetical protein
MPSGIGLTFELVMVHFLRANGSCATCGTQISVPYLKRATKRISDTAAKIILARKDVAAVSSNVS